MSGVLAEIAHASMGRGLNVGSEQPILVNGPLGITCDRTMLPTEVQNRELPCCIGVG